MHGFSESFPLGCSCERVLVAVSSEVFLLERNVVAESIDDWFLEHADDSMGDSPDDEYVEPQWPYDEKD